MSTASQSICPLSLPNDISPGATSHRPYNGLNMAQDRLREQENLRTQGKSYRSATTIDMLTDNVLVEIFDFCRLADVQLRYRTIWKWHLLVHVCRRWRQIIFASPRRLHLEIFCTDGTPVRSNLSVWPAIPIVIQYSSRVTGLEHHDEDNVVAALEHPDRVCYVGLHYIMRSQLERIVTVMQEPFPVLTCLSISSNDEDVPVIPSGFLAGSAPRLQEIHLTGIPFPSLPALFLSACDLVKLSLRQGLHNMAGYISPELMVASLVMLPRLEQIDIGCLPPDSPPDQRFLPLITRSVLPALTRLDLSSICGSVEDFLARIDTPRLSAADIHYSDQVVDFEVPQLSEFMNRSENLKRTLSGHCRIMVDTRDRVDFCIEGATGNEVEPRRDPETGIYVCLLCEWIDRQTLHLAQVLSGISPRLSNIIHLAIGCDMFEPWNDPDDFEWLQLLRPFSSVRTLFVAAIFATYVSLAGRDISRVIATDSEVLPALELLCLEDGPVSSIDGLTTTRRSGRPVTRVDKKEFEKRLQAYPP